METAKTSFYCLIFIILVAHNNNSTKLVAAGTVPVKVGVVLDHLDTWVGKLGLSCINMALSDFYSNHTDYKTRLLLNVRDSNGDIVGAAAAALDLVKNVQVQAIIGPENSMQANFVIDLGDKSHVPIISFSATSPSLRSSPYFFRATQNDASQVKAISAIVRAFGWRQIVPIYEDNEFGEGILPYLSESLAEIDAMIPYRSAISPKASDVEIENELYKLMTKSTRVFIVHMNPDLGIRIFDKAKEIGMMEEGYVWIITDGMTNLWSLMSGSSDDDMDSMQGVLGVRSYVPKSKELEKFKVTWRRKFLQDHNSNMKTNNPGLDIFGLWAYDATFALAMAVEKLGISNNFSFEFNTSNVSGARRTDLDSLQVSENGPKLRQIFASTEFRGLSGDFGFLNGGQLESSVFQIINVNGNGKKGIGFWTSKYGLIKKLEDSKNLLSGGYSTSKDNLGPIIWPGDSYSVPKGWEILTNGKKLLIGVPTKDGFNEFVKVVQDNLSSYKVSGYCIDVFEAAMAALPYDAPYNFTPAENADGDYNELIYQVYLGKYDAVVGDVSILANRSLYVDFTLPYTESGVLMVVPVKDYSKNTSWVFLRPLTWDLWVTSGCFFVFIGFVVWILEHRINDDFRGPPLHHIVTIFSFSFSTMVFAQRERVVSNLARSVMVIWLFVVLILTSSYTANLSSFLTVQQLKPTITDVNELLKNRKTVAYQDGSFVESIVKKVGFNSDQMIKFGTAQELDLLFTNGTIAAAFDEAPYLKLFLANYCHKYTTQDPNYYKTGGLGFVFPKGSPLVDDVSRAILNVTQGDEMYRIEKKWFEDTTNCSGIPHPISSLGIECFWGLFLIAGVVGILAILVFATQFLYQHKEVLLDYSKSPWIRFIELLKLFDRKDEAAEESKTESAAAAVQDSTYNNNYPQSPSTISLPRPSTSDYYEEGSTLTGIEDISSSGASLEIEIQPIITNE